MVAIDLLSVLSKRPLGLVFDLDGTLLMMWSVWLSSCKLL